MAANEIKDLKRENRELKKYLKALAIAVTEQAAKLDGIMHQPSTDARGKEVAHVANGLNYAADSAMRFGLRMEFTAINKIKSQQAELIKAAFDREFDALWQSIERRGENTEIKGGDSTGRAGD